MTDNGDFLQPNEQEIVGLSDIATKIVSDIEGRQLPDTFGQTRIFDYRPNLQRNNPGALLSHLINEEYNENVSALSTVRVGDRNFGVVTSGNWENSRGFDISLRAFPLTAEEMQILTSEKPDDVKEDIFLMAVTQLNRRQSTRDSSVKMFWHRTADELGLWKPKAAFSKDVTTYKQQEDLLKSLSEAVGGKQEVTRIKHNKRELIGVRQV